MVKKLFFLMGIVALNCWADGSLPESEVNLLKNVKAGKEEVSIHKIYPLGEKGLFIQGEPVVFALEVKNGYAEDKEITLGATVKDFFDETVCKKEVILKLEPLAVSKHQITLPGQKKLGFYSVDMFLKKDMPSLPGRVSSFCIVSPPETNDPFFGSSSFRYTRPMADAMRLIGMGTVMVMTGWASVEEEKGVYDWDKMDSEVDFWLSKGFRVIGTVMNQQPDFSHPWVTPLWARKEAEKRREQGGSPWPEEYFQRHGKFAEKLADHYKDRIKVWYMMNEINIPMRDAAKAEEAMEYYINMVRAFSDGARRADPECKIAGLGVSGAGEINAHPPYPDARKIWGRIHSCLDWFCPHPYPSPRTFGPGLRVPTPESFFRQALLDAVDVVRPNGKLNIGVTENGMSIVRGLPLGSPYQKEWAKYLARTMIIARSVPEMRFLAQFTVNDCEEGLGNYGLWELSGGGSAGAAARAGLEPAWPRPGVSAYATVSRFLNNVTEPEELNPHKDIFGYAFRKKDGGSIVALWTVSNEPVSFLIESEEEVRVHDLMGNKVKTLSKGTNELFLTDAPLFLVSNENGDKLAGAVKKGSFSLPLIRADARLVDINNLVVYVLNQVDSDLKLEIAVNPLKGASFVNGMKGVTIPANGKLPVEFELKDADITLLNGSTFSAKIIAEGRTAMVEEYLDLFTVARMKEKVVIDGDLSEFQTLVPIIIDNTSYLTPPDAAPGGLWTGPGDLSFKVWTAYDENYFYFAASVTDDVFIQEHTGYMTWAHDGFSLAFDTANDALSPATGGTQGYDGNDYEFSIALTKKGPQVYCQVASEERKELKKNLMDFPLAVKKTGKTVTNYELAIPLKDLLPLKAKKGGCFGFNFVYCDQDSPGGGIAPYWMGLTPGIHGGKDPSAYKTFIFLP
ncbi:MAG: sugar-binding protein [Victivallales bacterium]